MVGEGDQGNQMDKPSMVGTCPGVEVVVAGVKLPCLLDTGSQVMLFSETFFQKWLSGEQKQSPQDLHWLSLKAANGLQIPYTGYAILDFSVGGVTVPGKGVILVKDECLSAERGILGMNVISHYRAVSGSPPWPDLSLARLRHVKQKGNGSVLLLSVKRFHRMNHPMDRLEWPG